MFDLKKYDELKYFKSVYKNIDFYYNPSDMNL